MKSNELSIVGIYSLFSDLCELDSRNGSGSFFDEGHREVEDN